LEEIIKEYGALNYENYEKYSDFFLMRKRKTKSTHLLFRVDRLVFL